MERRNMEREIAELSDDELKEMIFDLSGRSYLTEDESRRLTEAAEEADARWRREKVIKRESERR